MTIETRTSGRASDAFAILVGAALPSLALGRAAFGVVVTLAMIFLLFWCPWREIVRILRDFARSSLGILVLIVFLVWLPNVLISDFPLRSFIAVFRSLLLVGMAALFCRSFEMNPRLMDTALRTFVIGAAASVIWALISILIWPELYWGLTLKGWHSDPLGTRLKSFSSLVVFIIPIVLLAGYRLGRRWLGTAGLISAGYLMLMWINYNRSAVAGLIASFAAIGLVIVLRSHSKKNALLVLGAILTSIIGVVVWLYLTRGALPAGDGTRDDWIFPVWLIDFQRQIIWSTTWNFAMQSPWFGLGANSINLMAGADRVIEGTHGLHVIPAHPHNWAIEVFAETGFFGFGALLITIIVLSVRIALQYRKTHASALLATIAIMAGYWVSGLFSFSYWSAWWQMSFMVSLAICFAVFRAGDGASVQR